MNQKGKFFTKTLYSNTRAVFDLLKNRAEIKEFYLAGGTALALQIGHRKSIDLDFFAEAEFDTNQLLLKLRDLNPIVISQDSDSLNITINGVKVSFFRYSYPSLSKAILFEGVKLANVLDIACMKLSAISSRGTKKDFVDMYFLLKEFYLERVFDSFDKKYSGVTYEKAHLLKSLNYFEDADKDPDPDYVENVDWEDVKKNVRNIVLNFGELEREYE